MFVGLLLFTFAVVLPVIGKKYITCVFPYSGETYCRGGHISFTTNISALIKQFSILYVSDCERHTRVRHGASLSPVM